MASSKVKLTTNLGSIEIQLCGKDAPLTVENFLTYVKDGHYDGTIFHRVIDGFMIQGGGMDASMREKATREPVKNEAHQAGSNKRGTIAMARTSVIDSATSQFFINLVDNDFLDYRNSSPAGYGYCVFGFVTDGMDVVDKIAKVKTSSRGYYDDVPETPVVIEKAEILPD